VGVQLTEGQDGGVLEITLSGRLTREDYERFVPEVECIIAREGKIRVLVDLRDFHGWNAGALWEDMRFDFRHFGDIERLAIVGEAAWERGMAAFCQPFTTAEIRYFERSQAGEAREWIRSGK
jgi:hypothetical protein